MKRLLSPATNSAGILTLLNALYAVAQALLNHYHVDIGLTAAQLATLDTAAVAYLRTQVTPVADPRVPGKLITELAPLTFTAEHVATVTAPPPPAAPQPEGTSQP